MYFELKNFYSIFELEIHLQQDDQQPNNSKDLNFFIRKNVVLPPAQCSFEKKNHFTNHCLHITQFLLAKITFRNIEKSQQFPLCYTFLTILPQFSILCEFLTTNYRRLRWGHWKFHCLYVYAPLQHNRMCKSFVFSLYEKSITISDDGVICLYSNHPAARRTAITRYPAQLHIPKNMHSVYSYMQ